jgi:biopolymer transport protein ExbB
MLEYILKGGYIMYPLIFLSVLAIAIIIDRVRAFRLAEGDSSSLRDEVIRRLEEGEIDRAIGACEKTRGPVAAVLLIGLYKYRQLAMRGRGMTEIEANVNKTMTDYAPHVIEALEKRLNLLIMIASVSPLLGMTGTVTGMIGAFAEMREGGVDAGGVAGGISEALITTAAGLLIAMPAVIFHSIFSKKVDRYVLEIEESSTHLIDFITLEHVEE